MKITENQLFGLVNILKDSVQSDLRGFFSFDFKTRIDLYNNILNQQSDKLVEIEPLTNNKDGENG